MSAVLLHAFLHPGPRWPSQLAAPVDPADTQAIMRAQSILSGALIGQCPPLTLDQARDVLAWYAPQP